MKRSQLELAADGLNSTKWECKWSLAPEAANLRIYIFKNLQYWHSGKPSRSVAINLSAVGRVLSCTIFGFAIGANETEILQPFLCTRSPKPLGGQWFCTILSFSGQWTLLLVQTKFLLDASWRKYEPVFETPSTCWLHPLAWPRRTETKASLVSWSSLVRSWVCTQGCLTLTLRRIKWWLYCSLCYLKDKSPCFDKWWTFSLGSHRKHNFISRNEKPENILNQSSRGALWQEYHSIKQEVLPLLRKKQAFGFGQKYFMLYKSGFAPLPFSAVLCVKTNDMDSTASIWQVPALSPSNVSRRKEKGKHAP